ncbi:MAG: RNA 2',3'-cyclic phosphodiesterase [Elusimicrobiales bacterium]|nr:RNA 2',3'-cyclic phosphodiesterase [Elusimicrobiales bacterium]
MRLFVASSFEPAFTAGLKAAADYARIAAPKGAVKWVEPGNFHLTYAFLGDLGQEGAETAKSGIEAGLAGLKPFTLAMGGFGVFPSARRPQVLWVGIGEGAPLLRELAARLGAGLAAAGLNFENRFEPHITIGRVKDSLPESYLRRFADYVPARRTVSRVASVELMESVLTPEGPVYRQVVSCPLL